MKFTRLDDEPKRAPNLSQTGAVYYYRWVDEIEAKYVQIYRVVGGSGAGNGSFSSDLYRLSDISMNTGIEGVDPSTGTKRISRNQNMSGFLRAVRDHIAAEMMKFSATTTPALQ